MTILDRCMVVGMVLGSALLLSVQIFLLSNRVSALESQESVRVSYEHYNDEFYNNED